MSRILTAVAVLPILIASILIPWLQPLFVALAAAALALALYEFYLLARKRDLRPDVVAMFLGSAAFFTIFLFDRPGPGRLMDLLLLSQLTLVVLTIGSLIAATLRGEPFERMLTSTGATLLGVIYIAFLGSHLVALRTGFDQPLSADLLSFFFLVLMGSDAGAYYAGRAIGKHKLAPKISPGKTWEGVVGGGEDVGRGRRRSSCRPIDGHACSFLVLSRATAESGVAPRVSHGGVGNLWRSC